MLRSMPSLVEITKTVGDQLVTAVKDAQDFALATVGTVVENTKWIPAPPFADRLPDPAQLVEAQMHIAEELLAAQRDYAMRLVKTLQSRTSSAAAS